MVLCDLPYFASDPAWGEPLPGAIFALIAILTSERADIADPFP
jgi:hypothetical protein